MPINVGLIEPGGTRPRYNKWFILGVKLFAHLENSPELLMLILKDDKIAEAYQEVVTKSNECELRALVKGKIKAFEDSLTEEERKLILNLRQI